MSDRKQLAKTATNQVTRAVIEGFALRLLQEPQVDCPVRHEFANGLYYREFSVPRGTFVIGRCHKEESFSVLLKGKARVLIDGLVHNLVAPMILPCSKGLNKIAVVEEDMVWGSFHANPTNEKDPDKIEDLLLEPEMSIDEVSATLSQEHVLQLEGAKE